MIELDGAIGEGGGQVLRTALSVASILGKKVRIYNIRAGRSNPGLRPQHLTVCKLLSEITGGSLQGATPGSTEIIFEPGKISGGNYSFDIGTAGSVTLLMQAALPVLLFAGSPAELLVKGGTHVSGAPTLDYFSQVFLPAAAKFGVEAKADMLSVGFFPKGGGSAKLSVSPSKLVGHRFEPQKHQAATYSIVSSNLPAHVAEREEKIIREGLSGMVVEGRVRNLESPSPGNAITLWSGRLGIVSLGESGLPAEKVALSACESLLSEIRFGSAVDAHLADQLLLYAALASGSTSYRTSQFSTHLTTNAEVLQRMTGRNIRLADNYTVEVF